MQIIPPSDLSSEFDEFFAQIAGVEAIALDWGVVRTSSCHIPLGFWFNLGFLSLLGSCLPRACLFSVLMVHFGRDSQAKPRVHRGRFRRSHRGPSRHGIAVARGTRHKVSSVSTYSLSVQPSECFPELSRHFGLKAVLTPSRG